MSINKKPRLASSKAFSDIISEWDLLAPLRFEQIASGDDITFSQVLLPQILEQVGIKKPRLVLDAGCGTGLLTSKLLSCSEDVIGIDPSKKSIQIAKAAYRHVNFENCSLEEYAERNASRFDMIVANMVLMDVLDLSSFLSSASAVLKQNSTLLFTITHPCFWPGYYGYENLSWFDYKKELIIEAPFRISKSRTSLVSTHVHRPLQQYVATLNESGFYLADFDELMPAPSVELLYPRPWGVPRYLLGIATRL